MAATCKCVNGHLWNARVIEDDPDTNSMTVEPSGCPECDSDNFEVIDEDFTDPHDD